MDKLAWQTFHNGGVKRYLFKAGVIDFGLCGGLLFLSLLYIGNIGYKLNEFDIYEMLTGYLIYLPLPMVIGVFLSFLNWIHYEEKYNMPKY